MANWLKLQARMTSRADQERNEILNVAIEVEEIFRPVMVDADKILSYSPFYNDEGIQDPLRSEIIFDLGTYLVVKMPYAQLDSLIQKHTKQK